MAGHIGIDVGKPCCCCLLCSIAHWVLGGREDKLEQREQTAQGLQTEALALKAELHRLADAMQAQAERQATETAEEKTSLARHQARLDTLQVCCLCTSAAC